MSLCLYDSLNGEAVDVRRESTKHSKDYCNAKWDLRQTEEPCNPWTSVFF